MKISVDTGLAVRLLVYIGVHPDGYMRQDMRKWLNTNSKKCADILRILLEREYIKTLYACHNHPGYIYTLARPASEITLKDVFTSFEGDLINGVCLFCRTRCTADSQVRRCPYGDQMLTLRDKIDYTLGNTTLQDLVDDQLTQSPEDEHLAKAE